MNPNKSKNKMLGNSRPLVDKKGKLKLQLKGRIFMQNVTDVLTVSKSGKICRPSVAVPTADDSSQREHRTLSKFFGRAILV